MDLDLAKERYKKTQMCIEQLKTSKQKQTTKNKYKSATEEEANFKPFYEDKFIFQKEWIELKTELQLRFTAIDQEKTKLFQQIKDNLKHGYGTFQRTSDKTNPDLEDNYLTSSKVLWALKDSEQWKEFMFPKSTGETQTSSKVLEALKDSGNLTADTFSTNTEEKSPKIFLEILRDQSKSSDYSNKKESTDEIKMLTESDLDTVSQASNIKNEQQKLEN